MSKPCKVLLFDAENGTKLVYERLSRLADYYGPLNGQVKVVCESGVFLNTTKGRAKMLATLKAERPDVVVLDPLYRFHTAEENSEREMHPVLGFLDEASEAYGITLIVVHHTNKSFGDGRPSKMNPDRLRGSTVIPGWATSILMIDGDPTKGLRVSPTLRSAQSDDIELELDEELGMFRPKHSALDSVLVGHLQDVGGSESMPSAKSWVADLLQLSERQAGRLIEQVAQRGRVVVDRLDGKTKLVRLPD